LGIKDLDKFSRALRMRWLCHDWDLSTKPWENLLKVSDRSIFFSSTIMQIGNGKILHFGRQDGSREVHPKTWCKNCIR
jgi:hypothetical protein